MSKNSLLPQIIACNLGLVCMTATKTAAQVTTDNSINTQVNIDGNVTEITGGEARGNNLFHSFQDFSVPANTEAFFNNASDISNIFSRVTGGNISNINGTIRVNDASLFLVNPAGILFGAGARLDLGGGSFYGSTADSILFDSGEEFSATDIDNPPLLTINAPIGFSFRDNPASITNRSTQADVGLEVAPGATIGLIGGDINLEGGFVTAPGAIVELGGLSAAGEVSFTDGSFEFPDEVDRSNVELTNDANVSVAGNGGGFINVNANNLLLSDTSELIAGIDEDMGSPNTQAGDITIDATESVRIVGVDEPNVGSTINPVFQTGIRNNIGDRSIVIDRLENPEQNLRSSAVGNGGSISIDTNSLILENNGKVSTVAFGTGNAGDINIVSENISIAFGSIESFSRDGAIGNPGNIAIVNGGEISLNSFTNNAFAGIQNQIFNAEGDVGAISIDTGSLTLGDFSIIQTDTRGEATGNAGDITIQAAESIVLDGNGNPSLIIAEIQQGGIGDAGDININANVLTARNGAQITARTNGQGDAGNLTITTNDSINLENGAQFISSVASTATGNGGDISLFSEQLNLTNNSQIFSDIVRQGANPDNPSTGGDINLDIAGDINFNNGNLIRAQVIGGSGNAGNINIETDGSFFSTNGNLILADSQALGNGGNITITAQEQIVIEGFSDGNLPSIFFTGLFGDNANGVGGNVEINASELFVRDVATIAANNVGGTIGSAGNIIINVDNLSLAENAFINASTANNSDSGLITVNAQTLDLASGGKILVATDGGGNAGNINLNIDEQITIDNSIESSAPFFDFGEGAQLINDLQSSPSGIYANTTENAVGDGGSININTLPGQTLDSLVITNDGQIVADSEGTGSGGSIFINSQNLELSNDGIISASTNSGLGGSISLTTAENLTLRGGSQISAEAANDADGGNVNINSQFVIAFPDGNNDILASAEGGMGGNININAESLFGIQERPANNFTNDIDASSQFSLDGNVNVNVFNFDPIQGVVELPTSTVEAENTVAQTCSVDGAIANTNSFTIKGKGGVPPAPELPLSSYNIPTDNNSVSAIPEPLETAKGKIQPARGIEVKPDGSIALVAYHTDNSGRRIHPSQTDCSN